jgi:hypothetical protein
VIKGKQDETPFTYGLKNERKERTKGRRKKGGVYQSSVMRDGVGALARRDPPMFHHLQADPKKE